MRRLRLLASLWCLLTAACGPDDFDQPGSIDNRAYASLFPYFAEFCALSQIKQKQGMGAESLGGIGGHAVFYLNGACRAAEAGQTTIQLCDEPGAEPSDGVGISMNAHFRFAKWVATPGRDFFLHGNLALGAPLTRADYDAVQAEARRLGIYDGVEFHASVFDDMPAGTTREIWKYEVSVGTDYGISLGRGRFCARLPVNREQLAAMIAYLNAQNAPYRAREREFEWKLVQDNCIHLAHNALAAAGVWTKWPTDQPLLLAVFDFPVPLNEFVALMRRTDDAGLLDLRTLRADTPASTALIEFDQLPLRPGAIMESRPPQSPNALYDTDVKLIFYDDPNLGRYPRWFQMIREDPARFDLHANLRRVLEQYRSAIAARRSLSPPEVRQRGGVGAGEQSAAFTETEKRLYRLLEARADWIETQLADITMSTPRR
ncbi:MAG TPA: hypothetical protein VE684_19690 [Crenalkalicoccus sp.]|nr:hypothetical protein [Crenalkalicoccus sp.]